MKRFITIVLILFSAISLYAYDLVFMGGLFSGFQSETATINNYTVVNMFAPEFGGFVSFDVYKDDAQTGVSISSTTIVCNTGNKYLQERIFVGAAIRPPADIINASCNFGLVLQPEHQEDNAGETFLFPIGLGFDFVLGSMAVNGFGASVNITSYPVMFAKYFDKSGNGNSMKIEFYGRIAVGISVGMSAHGYHIHK